MRNYFFYKVTKAEVHFTFRFRFFFGAHLLEKRVLPKKFPLAEMQTCLSVPLS